MTKLDIVKKITAIVGDPNASVFGSRAWEYLVEAIYALSETLTPIESMRSMRSVTGQVTTNISGTVRIPSSLIPYALSIRDVLINDIFAKEVDEETYRLMKSNSLYAPYGNEFYYRYENEALTIISGQLSTLLRFEIRYVIDMSSMFGNATDSTEIAISNSLIYKAIPVAQERLKAEVGLTT